MRLITTNTTADESHAVALLHMKPGVWYCFSDYAGCDAMPEGENHINGRSIEKLEVKGFVESVPVFEGFVTKKHRITPMGVAWLAAR